MSRPKCMWCGKPLQKHTVYVEDNASAWRKVTWGNDGNPVVVDGRHVKQITKTYTGRLGNSDEREPYAWHVWLGDYGYQGTGDFHSGDCARRYGHAIAKQIRPGAG